MDIETIRKEIEKRQSANYKYLFLSDRPGDILDKDNCIVHPQNRTWIQNIERDKNKVVEFIASNPDEMYRLGFCRKARGVVDVVLVNPNNDKPVEVDNEIEIPALTKEEMDEKVRSFEQALEDRAKIEKLEYMVRERDRKITELEEELAACYSDLQDNETGEMADNAVGIIGQIAPLLPALADKYFELQERKLQAMQGTPRQQPTENQFDEYQNFEQ